MGIFRQTISIIRSDDLALVRNGYLKKEDVRQMEIPFLIDTGAYLMCINEAIQRQMEFPVIGEEEVNLADGTLRSMQVVGPIEIRIFNRRTVADALVLPGDSEPLFGCIPLEAMDLIVDPLEGTLKLPPDRPYIGRTIVK
ncbi:MAG: clan AA aspartic protease [Saprospiraceae bacterium]